MSNDQKTNKKLGEWIVLLITATAIMIVAYLYIIRPILTNQDRQQQANTATQTPTHPPMMSIMNASTEDSNMQQTKIETAMKTMEPKYKALSGIMQSVMGGGQEPTPEMRGVGTLIMQVMQYDQAVRMLGVGNSERAQKRLDSGLAILQDLVDEAYEGAQKSGLIPNTENTQDTTQETKHELVEVQQKVVDLPKPTAPVNKPKCR